MSTLSSRGPNAKGAARLPALQTSRVDDPQVQKALDSIREWVEVRLGSRGDPYERAVTRRDLEQALAPLNAFIDSLGAFDGSLETLRTTSKSVLPDLRGGSFAQVGEDLYYCTGKVWRKVTLV